MQNINLVVVKNFRKPTTYISIQNVEIMQEKKNYCLIKNIYAIKNVNK